MSIQQYLDHAKSTGILKLKSTKEENLSMWKNKTLLLDEVQAVDLSCNKLTKIPTECLAYYLMERLILSGNILTSIPKSIMVLRSLVFLDLSRNQLKHLPIPILQLPFLEILLLSNNHLEEIPEEINLMKNLIELDVACNKIRHLPSQIGDVISLRSLNLRRNYLEKIPIEISFLPLVDLDLSSNDIVAIPVEFCFITTLVHLSLEGNPLSSPPVNICERGKLHIFKYLYEKAIQEGYRLRTKRNKQYARFYQNKSNNGILPNEFTVPSNFRAKAIKTPDIKANLVDTDKYNNNVLRRRNAFRSTDENTDLSYKSAQKVVLNQMEYINHTDIKKQDKEKCTINNLFNQTSDDIQNISDYRHEKSSYLPKQIDERSIFNNKRTRQSILSYTSFSAVAKTQADMVCTSIEKNNDNVDSRDISIVGQVSFIECSLFFTFPIIFLILSLYVIVQQFIHRHGDKDTGCEMTRKKTF